MKWLFITVAVVLLAGSFYADYKWRQWMAARKSERDRDSR